MTGIREIHYDQTGGILRDGKPAGLWMSRVDALPCVWMGIDADGERADRILGTFAEILTWLFIRARILQPNEEPKVRNASRDPEWRIAVDTDPGIRVPGAKIARWEYDDPWDKPKQDGWGTNTIKPYRDEPEKEKRSRGGYGGAPSGPHASTLERDEEIIRMKRKGYTNTEAARELGVSPSTVRARVKLLRADGRLPAFDAPRPKAKPEEEDDERNRKRRWTEDDNDEMIYMIREGYTNKDIARALGRSLKSIQWQSIKFLAEGRITEKDLGGYRLAARKARLKGVESRKAKEPE